MTSQGRRILAINHKWLWVQKVRFLPVIIWLLLSCGLASNKVYANERSQNLHLESTQLAPSNSKESPHDKNHQAVLPEDAENTDDPINPDNPNDPEESVGTDNWQELDDNVDDVWKIIYKLYEISYLNIEQSIFSALTRSEQNRKALPLFLLHRSWKSFLS